MGEKVPGMAEIEEMRSFLEAAEERAGIAENQRMSQILIGFLERHFILEVPERRVRRKNGRGQTVFKDKGILKFKRSSDSMPSQEQISHRDLEVKLRSIPGKQQYFMELEQIFSNETKTDQSGPIAFDQIFPVLDEFLERLVSE